MQETSRRREIQDAYNKAHGIVPKSIKKEVRDVIHAALEPDKDKPVGIEKDMESMSRKELEKAIASLEKDMKKAAAELRFEDAAALRNELLLMKGYLTSL